MKDVIIVGSGYAGLNAYHEIKGSGDVKLFSLSPKFTYYTGIYRYLVKGKPYEKGIDMTTQAKVKEIDLKDGSVVLDRGTLKPESLIVAVGCNREKQEKSVLEGWKGRCFATEDPYDEYIAIQLALLKGAKHHTSFLKWLGPQVSSGIRDFLEDTGITTCESPDVVIPRCDPNPLIGDFLKVDSRLRKGKSYVVGDAADLGPKLGELSMRMGAYAGRDILGKSKGPFSPVFIHMFFNQRGKGVRVITDYPWGGSRSVVKRSFVYNFMKDFLPWYYLKRNGKMGFLSRL